MLGNLHVRFGVGAEVQLLGLRHGTGFAFGTSDWSAASLKCRPVTKRAWSSTTDSYQDCWAASICAAGAVVSDGIAAS